MAETTYPPVHLTASALVDHLLRDGKLPSIDYPDYPVVYMDTDAQIVCDECANSNMSSIVDFQLVYPDDGTISCSCGRRITHVSCYADGR